MPCLLAYVHVSSAEVASAPHAARCAGAVRTLSDAPHQPLSADMAALAKAGIGAGDLKTLTASGHAIALGDQQVLINTALHNFPATAVTVEFWMRSVDKCHHGTPFSYATGEGKVASCMDACAGTSCMHTHWRALHCLSVTQYAVSDNRCGVATACVSSCLPRPCRT